MATNSLQLNTASPVAGLGTSLFNVVLPGEYTVEFKSTLPLGSNLQVVVNKNGGPVLTVGGLSTNPSATQPILGSSVRMACVATDIITVVLSSANAVDALPNSVKSIINLYQGE
jgi:hypothetical protein